MIDFKPKTVGDIREAIKDLPDDMEVKAISDYEHFIVDDVEHYIDHIILHLSWALIK